MENNTLSQDEYSDIKIPHFNNEKEYTKEIEEIMELTKDISADWRKRESAIKRLGGIMLSNFGFQPAFIKSFNNKICLNLSVQLVDLRSSLMKDACRIAVLAAITYNEAIESAVEKLISPLVLFKLVGSANKVISDTGSSCVLEIIKCVESGKIIGRIHEQSKSKCNTIKVRASQQLHYIVSNYKQNTISKNASQIEEFIYHTTHDANNDVRAGGRKVFLKYLEVSQSAAVKLMATFEHSVQKTINDELRDIDQGSHKNSSVNKYYSNFENGETSTSSTTGINSPNVSNFSQWKNKNISISKNEVTSTNKVLSNNFSKTFTPSLPNTVKTTNSVVSISNTQSKRKNSNHFESSPDRNGTNSLSKSINTSKQFSKTEAKSLASKMEKLF